MKWKRGRAAHEAFLVSVGAMGWWAAVWAAGTCCCDGNAGARAGRLRCSCSSWSARARSPFPPRGSPRSRSTPPSSSPPPPAWARRSPCSRSARCSRSTCYCARSCARATAIAARRGGRSPSRRYTSAGSRPGCWRCGRACSASASPSAAQRRRVWRVRRAFGACFLATHYLAQTIGGLRARVGTAAAGGGGAAQPARRGRRGVAVAAGVRHRPHLAAAPPGAVRAPGPHLFVGELRLSPPVADGRGGAAARGRAGRRATAPAHARRPSCWRLRSSCRRCCARRARALPRATRLEGLVRTGGEIQRYVIEPGSSRAHAAAQWPPSRARCWCLASGARFEDEPSVNVLTAAA